MDIELAKLSLLTAPTQKTAVLDDTAPMLEIWNDGQDVSNARVTAATVTLASSVFTFTINDSADTRLGTSGQIDCTGASYDTLTEFVRKVNSVDGWYCRPLMGLPTSSTNATLIDVGESKCLKICVQCKIDTSAALIHGYHVTATEGMVVACSPGTSPGNKLKAIYDERGCVNCLFYLKYTATLGGTSTLVIYSINGVTETVNYIGAIIPAATTVANTLDFTQMPITSNPGERLLVLVTDNTSLAITESSCIGKSIRT